MESADIDIKMIAKEKYGQAAAQAQDVRDLLSGTYLVAESIIPQIEGKFASAFIRARKTAAPCCAIDCCRG